MGTMMTQGEAEAQWLGDAVRIHAICNVLLEGCTRTRGCTRHGHVHMAVSCPIINLSMPRFLRHSCGRLFNAQSGHYARSRVRDKNAKGLAQTSSTIGEEEEAGTQDEYKAALVIQIQNRQRVRIAKAELDTRRRLAEEAKSDNTGAEDTVMSAGRHVSTFADRIGRSLRVPDELMYKCAPPHHLTARRHHV